MPTSEGWARQRLFDLSWAGGGTATRAPSLMVGDDVLYPSLGEGVVVGLEADIAHVRFARDGRQRSIVAESSARRADRPGQENDTAALGGCRVARCVPCVCQSWPCCWP